MIAFGFDINRPRHHPISHYREGDVVNEVPSENLLHGSRQGIDAGSLGESRFSAFDSGYPGKNRGHSSAASTAIKSTGGCLSGRCSRITSQAIRSQLISPRQYNGNRSPETQHGDDHFHYPGWRAETVGCQSRHLCDQPRRHNIGNGYTKYVSAIELTEERQGLWLAMRPTPVRIHDGRHFLTTRSMLWHHY